MKPPDERPETLILVLSTLSAGKVTACAATQARAAAPTKARTNFLKVIESLLRLERNNPSPRVFRGFLEQRIKKRRGRACGMGYFLPLRIGTSISVALISWTRDRSGFAPGRAPGDTRKRYIDCIAWWSCLLKVFIPFVVSKVRPSIAAINFSVFVSPLVFLSAATIAIAADMPPAVKKSGGDLKRR